MLRPFWENPDEAATTISRPSTFAPAVRFRPEAAITRFHLAELLLDRYPDQRSDAQEHLDIAIAELREMKMQPALERALGHKGLLKA